MPRKPLAFDVDAPTAPALDAPTDDSSATESAMPAFTIKEDAPTSKTRLSIAITADGKVDFDSMRPSNVKKLAEVISISDRRQLGLIDDAGGVSKAAKFTDSFVDGLYDLLGWAEAETIGRARKVPSKVANIVFTFTKEEKAELRQPTKNLLAKYGPDKLPEFQDEVTLALALYRIQTAKMEALDKWLAENKAQLELVRKQEATRPAIVG